jgi:hypothetical protein
LSCWSNSWRRRRLFLGFGKGMWSIAAMHPTRVEKILLLQHRNIFLRKVSKSYEKYRDIPYFEIPM